MSATDELAAVKSRRRHNEKVAKREAVVAKKGKPMTGFAGMGRPELKDRVEQLSRGNPDYSQNHDGKLWMLPG